MVLLVITLPLAVHFRIPSLWFLAPFALLTVTRRRYDEYGLTFREPGSLRFHVRVCLVIFGSYCVAHYGYARWWLGRSFHPTLPPGFPTLVVDQLLVVGLSEEFFFRGYLQTQLNGWLGRPYRFLGAQWGWGLIAASVLFGICHLVEGDLTRLRVIFFGVFAGWLRERTGTIAVPAAYHGFANLLYDFMQRSMRSVT
jgi:membrane protease YdiL (CAAX protease family)